MPRPRLTVLLPTFLLALALPVAGTAEPFAYGVGVAPFSVFELRLWDLADGSSSLIAPIDFEVAAPHLTFGPDGTLYALGLFDGGLVVIDPATGETTEIGPPEPPHGLIQITGFAADACGRLWASGLLINDGPGPLTESWLFRVDTETGNLERIASGDVFTFLALVGEGETLWGLGFDGLVRIDLRDLSVQVIGGEPPAIPRGLGFTADGTLWATAYVPPPPITLPPFFGLYSFTVDPETGEIDDVSESIPIPLGEFTIRPPAGTCLGGVSPLEVPALGPAGLALLALLLALGAVVKMRGHGAAARRH